MLPVGLDQDGNILNRQIGGDNDSDRFLKGLQAAAESGALHKILGLQMNVPHEVQKDLHPFAPYAQQWFERYKGHLKANTKVNQLGWLKNASNFFGHEPIEEINVDRIQDYINSMQNLTTDVIKKKVNFLSQILNTAYEDELISRNPAKSSRLNFGGQTGKGISALPKEVIRELFDRIRTASDKHIQLWLALMLHAGMRREEMLSLRWEDIDFESKYIHIKRSVTYASSQPELGPPKTPKSERNVPMSDELIRILLPLRESSGYLVTTESGELLSEYECNTLREAVRSYTGIPALDARQLRHSYASMLHASGVETRAVGACLGHTKSATTDRYIQVDPTRLYDIRNQMTDYVLC